MQPDTAFWILSSIAQASAALSGLSIVVMVFQLRIRPSLRADVSDDDNVSGPVVVTGWARAIHVVALSAVMFLSAAIGSLATLGLVTPGSLPVPTQVLVMTISMLVATALGGGLMALLRVLPCSEPRAYPEKSRGRSYPG